MLRIHLDDATRNESHALRRRSLPAVARDRPGMPFLSEQGWSAPRSARHRRCYPQTARDCFHDFRRRGTPALYPGRPGPAPDAARRDRGTSRPRELLGQGRTWTSSRPAAALSPHRVQLGARQVRRYLKLRKAGYRRTASTVAHQPDPQEVERARTTRSSWRKGAGR